MGRQARREVPRCLEQRLQLGSFDRDRGRLDHDATSDQPFGHADVARVGHAERSDDPQPG
jgi:hypothetical protein